MNNISWQYSSIKRGNVYFCQYTKYCQYFWGKHFYKAKQNKNLTRFCLGILSFTWVGHIGRVWKAWTVASFSKCKAFLLWLILGIIKLFYCGLFWGLWGKIKRWNRLLCEGGNLPDLCPTSTFHTFHFKLLTCWRILTTETTIETKYQILGENKHILWTSTWSV